MKYIVEEIDHEEDIKKEIHNRSLNQEDESQNQDLYNPNIQLLGDQQDERSQKHSHNHQQQNTSLESEKQKFKVIESTKSTQIFYRHKVYQEESEVQQINLETHDKQQESSKNNIRITDYSYLDDQYQNQEKYRNLYTQSQDFQNESKDLSYSPFIEDANYSQSQMKSESDLSVKKKYKKKSIINPKYSQKTKNLPKQIGGYILNETKKKYPELFQDVKYPTNLKQVSKLIKEEKFREVGTHLIMSNKLLFHYLKSQKLHRIPHMIEALPIYLDVLVNNKDIENQTK